MINVIRNVQLAKRHGSSIAEQPYRNIGLIASSALLVVMSQAADARQVEGFGIRETKQAACDKAREMAHSLAFSECTGKGGVSESLAGSCSFPGKSGSQYEARVKVTFTCREPKSK